MATSADQKYMQRALDLAGRARGKTSPNPLVGAVIVRNGRIVGEGYHHRTGLPHAEILALNEAGTKARGATAYVTLEPCCHVGRTGPCTEALMAAGIKRVVYATKDPDPRVNGRGVSQLRRAGIKVTGNVLAREARDLNEYFLTYQEYGRPFVILKLAQSVDGRIATMTGDSKWISSLPARKYVHRLRADVDAVVVGMDTVRVDDPELTVRLVGGGNPHRVVLTNSHRFPPKSKLIRLGRDGRTIIASSREKNERFARRNGHSRLIYWDVKTDRTGKVDLRSLLVRAGEFGFRSLLVEGGATVATQFLRQRLVDKVVLFLAPIVIGAGKEAFGELGIRRIEDAIKFERSSFATVGTDGLFIGYPSERTRF